jgi:hypothetical protein
LQIGRRAQSPFVCSSLSVRGLRLPRLSRRRLTGKRRGASQQSATAISLRRRAAGPVVRAVVLAHTVAGRPQGRVSWNEPEISKKCNELTYDDPVLLPIRKGRFGAGAAAGCCEGRTVWNEPEISKEYNELRDGDPFYCHFGGGRSGLGRLPAAAKEGRSATNLRSPKNAGS